MNFQEFWIEAARALFNQAVAGAPELGELPDNAARAARLVAGGGLTYAATLEGEFEGSFAVLLDHAIADLPLLGEGIDQKTAWGELLRETIEAAAGELAARTGTKCRIVRFVEAGCEAGCEVGTDGVSDISAAPSFKAARSFELRSGERAWQIAIVDDVRSQAAGADQDDAKIRQAAVPARPEAGSDSVAQPAPNSGPNPAPNPEPKSDPGLNPGLELLLDVELEASLRFGSREMPLAEILELGPGDVVQLDRHVADPVDLAVGDKIVARGEVVLVNGNYGLRVTEVAAPRKRLESIRCLF
jgi:flagellar motor switch protein FliN